MEKMRNLGSPIPKPDELMIEEESPQDTERGPVAEVSFDKARIHQPTIDSSLSLAKSLVARDFSKKPDAFAD